MRKRRRKTETETEVGDTLEWLYLDSCVTLAIFLTFAVIVYQMGRLCGGAHEISGIKAPIFLHGWAGVVDGGVGGGGVGVVGCGVVWCGGWWAVGGVIRLSFQSNSNSPKLSLWYKKNHCQLNEGLKI